MKEAQELIIIDPKEFGLEETKATEMTSGLKSIIEERNSLETIYDELIKRELNPETLKQAKSLRMQIRDNRTKGIEPWHKANKAFYLAGGRFVDAVKNKEVVNNERMEAKLEEIEQYFINLEAIRLTELETSRKLLLEPYGEINRFVDLKKMDDETFNKYLGTEKLAFETRLEQEKQAELARIEAEKKAEEERLERERLAKVEQEKKDAELAELQKKQELRNSRTKELQPYIVFIRDYNTLIELPEKEYKSELSEIKKGAELEWEAQRQKQIEDAKKAEALEVQRKKDELEAKRLQAENDKLKQQQEQEKARIEAEEAEKLAKEKALANADDKEKVRSFYDKYVAVAESFPILSSKEGIEMGTRVIEALIMVKKLIIEDSKTLL